MLPLGIPVGLLLLISDVTQPLGSDLLVVSSLGLIPLVLCLMIGFTVALFYCRNFKDLSLVLILSFFSTIPICGGVYIMGQGG